MLTSCGCTSEAEHAKHLFQLLHENVTANDLEDLSDDELFVLADRYKLIKRPRRDYTSAALLVLLLANRSLYKVNKRGRVTTVRPYYETPLGQDKRLASFAQNFTFKIINNAIRIVANKYNVKWLQWITRPDLSKTGPCPICAPRHLRRFHPNQFVPRMPAHPGCVCQWQYIYDWDDVQLRG